MDPIDFERIENNKTKLKTKSLGSLLGFIYVLIIGFGLYFILNNITNELNLFDYSKIIKGMGEGNIFYKMVWMIRDFTQPQFYGAILPSLGLILGGFLAWRLALDDSKYKGFEVCYGAANMWPWVFASQVISLGLAIFVLNSTGLFASGDFTSLPTFITVAGAPPSLMLMYGPNYKNLFTTSILGGVLSFPLAFWMMTKVLPVFELPSVVGNVLTMAVTGIVIGQILKVLPWIKKLPIKPIKSRELELSIEEKQDRMEKPFWFIRRVFADFAEAPFYGNEIAGLFVIIGISIEWFLKSGQGIDGNLFIPAIILSQFIGSSIGILLYFTKYVEKGWYATYVPVVSSGPACVLIFGGSIKVAIVAGILGGILGGPIAEYIADRLPDHIHSTVANVSSMAITTVIVLAMMNILI